MRIHPLIHRPKLLLMDEPFGALDPFTRESMGMELLRVWEKYRKTVIFVTHDVAEAVFLADKVVILTSRPGQVTTAKTWSRPAVVHHSVISRSSLDMVAGGQ